MQTHTRRARWKKTERKKCVIKATATGCKVAAGGLYKSTAKGSRLRWWRSFAVGKRASSCVPDTGDATVTPLFCRFGKVKGFSMGKMHSIEFLCIYVWGKNNSHWTYLVASWKYPRNWDDQLTRQGKGILHCKASVICPFCKLGSISRAIFFRQITCPLFSGYTCWCQECQNQEDTTYASLGLPVESKKGGLIKINLKLLVLISLLIFINIKLFHNQLCQIYITLTSMSNHEEFIQEIECKHKLISIFPRGLVFDIEYPYRIAPF